jgi:phosphoribosylformylglycinamidine (FGAM) synthase-like amidotransferase family enzyme
MASNVPVLIITGYGLNCEDESCYAWKLAGAQPQCVHFNDLLENPLRLRDFSGLMFIGGFSYGDHMTSGHVFALRAKHRMSGELERFIAQGKLIMGVCNGFQIMVKLGLLPGLDSNYFTQKLSIMQNDCGTFQNFWVDLRFEPDSPCVFTSEGKVFTLDRSLLLRLESSGCIPCRYADPETGNATQKFPFNPNGSLHAIAGLCDPTGRIFGLMPHPEAYLYPENHPRWEIQRKKGIIPENGLGLNLFRNAVEHLKQL